MIAYVYGGISKAALVFCLRVLIFLSGIELLYDLKLLQLQTVSAKAVQSYSSLIYLPQGRTKSNI